MLRIIALNTFGFALAAVCVVAGAHESLSSQCTRPAESAPTSSVELPDYRATAQADEIAAAENDPTIAAWQRYQHSVGEALALGDDPRERALASLVLRVSTFSFRADPASATALVRASQDAPDDAMAQWIALRSADGVRSTGGQAAMRRLRHLEPDNAAVWIEDLNDAAMRHDAKAVDEALYRLATSSRFNLHHGELIAALSTAYARHPSAEFADSMAAVSQEIPSEALPFTAAMTVVSMYDLPAFQHIVEECRAKRGESFARASDCGAIGHLMAAHSDTTLAARIGYAVLRVSGNYSAQDAAAARGDEWVQRKFMAALGGTGSSDHDDPFGPGILEFERDWATTGNESVAMRRTLERAGVPVVPPDDWTDDLAAPADADRAKASFPP